jgi:hypothetical protein
MARKTRAAGLQVSMVTCDGDQPLVGFTLLPLGCGGNESSSISKSNNTPAGTYNFQVTATHTGRPLGTASFIFPEVAVPANDEFFEYQNAGIASTPPCCLLGPTKVA